jgi:signal transduction histidine kinase
MTWIEHVVTIAIATAAPHRIFFETLTGITAGLVSGGVLWLRKTILKKEHWILFFGIAFAIFFAQYLTPAVFHIYARINHENLSSTANAILSWVASLASAANNIFFLAAAFSLRRTKAPVSFWVFFCFLATATAIVDSRDLFGAQSRFPDALLSAGCLGFFGFALFSNISRRRRRWLGLVALSGALMYGGINVLSALSLSRIEGGPNAVVTRNIFNAALKEGLDLKFFNFKSNAQLARHAVDTFLIMLSLPLKILLAGGGFILIIRSIVIISPRQLHLALERINRRIDQEQEADVLADGILSAIGKTFSADTASILFRLPGLHEHRFLSIEWSSQSEEFKKPTVQFLAAVKASREGFVLTSGELYEQLGPNTSEWVEAGKDEKSEIVAPILYRGIVIGCLKVAWNNRNAFTVTASEQVRGLAQLLGSSVEARRHLETMYFWSGQLQSFDYEVMSGGYGGVVIALASLVHDTLSPQAVALSFQVGFQPVWAVLGDRGRFSGDLTENQLDLRKLLHLCAGVDGTIDDMHIRKLEVRVKQVQIGQLLIAWSAWPVDSMRPVVFPDNLLLRTLASQIAVSVLDAAHVGLWAVLNRLQTKLSSSEIATKQDWFSATEVAVRDAGLLWAVVAYAHSFALEGEHDFVNIVRSCAPAESDSARYNEPILITLPPSSGKTRKMIQLSLPNSGAMLWLGLGHSQFEDEIQVTLPWRTFLDRLVEGTDAALSRITSREEVQRLREEAHEYKSLVVATADTTTLIHDVKNLAKNFRDSAGILEEARCRGQLQAPERLLKSVASLSKSAQRLYQITDTVMNFKSSEDGSSCPLIVPIYAMQELVEPVLDGHKIQLHVGVEAKIVIGMPSHEAQQSIWTLVSNSIDSINQKGNIWIEADDFGDLILCHIRDDGPGIPPEVQEQLFELGNSTKGTGGKGLFLAKQLLERRGGCIALKSSSPHETIFTLTFPSTMKKATTT